MGFPVKHTYGVDSPGYKRRLQDVTLTKLKAMIRDGALKRRDLIAEGLLGRGAR